MLWRDKGLVERDITKDIRDHHAKHRVFAGLKEAQSFIPLLTDRLSTEELARRIEEEVLEPNRESTFLARLGAYDSFKQYGFYVDIDEQAHFQPAQVIHRKDAEYLLTEASSATELTRSSRWNSVGRATRPSMATVQGFVVSVWAFAAGSPLSVPNS